MLHLFHLCCVLLCMGCSVLAGADVVWMLQEKTVNDQIPWPLRRAVWITPLDEGGVQITTRKEDKYCALSLPFEIPAAPGTLISFDVRVEAERKFRPFYIGIAFKDQNGKTFFAKQAPSELWTTVTLPVEKLTSVSGEVFSPQDLISKFQIYGRHNEPVPAGVAKLQVRNFQITIDPVKVASMPDRLSYSANLLFDWKVFANAESYEVAYSQDPALPADKTRISKTDRPFLLSDSALAPGIWHYQVTALPQQKIIARGSLAIPEKRHTYRIGDYDFASFGTAPHPRLKNLAEFNIFHDPSIPAALEDDLKYTLTPDADIFRPGADPAIKTRADWLRIHGTRVADAAHAMRRIGQCALVTGDSAAVAKAKELALAVARNWDPNKATHQRNLDLASGNLIIGLGFCYDAAYGVMTPEERAEVDACLMTRGRQFWDHIHPFRGNEAQNHPWDNVHSFAFASVVCDMLPEERATWFDYALKLYAYRFLPSLGFEGENNEGLAYWRFGFNLMTRYLDLARQAAKINLYELDYVQKTGAFGLYSAPLAGYEMSFADNGTPNHHGIWTYSRPLCRKLAIETEYPEILWYASIPRSGKLEAKVPLFMPQSVSYPHIGVTLFNTFLPDARENVAVGFHSGKYFAAHQHADQNTFSINAYGDKLIVDGGYYDWWGSNHFYDYSTSTLAHNTLLVNGKGQALMTDGADGVTRNFADSPSFGYVCGDAGNPKVYAGKLEAFQREMVFVKPDAVITFDRVKASPDAVWSYLLHAQGEKPVWSADGNFEIRRQYAHLRGKILTNSAVTVKPSYETPPNDMLSSSMLDFHEKEWTIQADFKGTECLAAMEIRSANEAMQLNWMKRENPDAVGVAAEGLCVAFRRGTSGKFTLDDISSDGAMAAVRTDRAGNVIGALLVDGTFLEYRGKKLCQLAKAGKWSFPETSAPVVKAANDRLTFQGKPVPAESYTVVNGDGSRTNLISAKMTIPADGYLTIDAPDTPHYILGRERNRYVGRAPRKLWVEKGDYLLSFTGSGSRNGKINLQLEEAKPIAAKTLPESYQVAENAVLLEAESPSRYEGEELYVIGRPFCSGGKFGFRFHQSDQLLHWDFAVKTAGKYRLAMRVASRDQLIRDLLLPDGKMVTVSVEKSGGEGREAADWKWVEIPVDLDLPAGKTSMEIRFNHGIGALDVIALLPEK